MLKLCKFLIVMTLLASSHAFAGWQLTFQDEFNGTSLDSSKWTPTYRWGDRTLTGNSELECYMEDNITFANGSMNLQAKQESLMCPKIDQIYNYTSGAIASFDKFSQAYGYFEMRAQLPAGKGLWPAFWLLPQSGAWPPEIDIMENIGEPTRAYMTYHYNSDGHQESVTSFDGPDLTTSFHTYGIDWQPGLLVWYIDGQEVKRYSDPNVISEPMYVLANLGVGGFWPGSPDDSTVFPATMSVDYIRVYKRVNDGEADATPPFGGPSPAPAASVTIYQPVNGATYPSSSWTTLVAAPTGAVKVVFTANGATVCTATEAPYNCSYATPNEAGPVTITATAYNSDGVSVSQSIAITIE